MALACRICHATLQAMESGRCRKCRQLVCPKCVGEGSFRSTEGFLCRSCAEAETAAKGV